MDTRTNHRNSRRGGPVATLGVALACTTSASDGGSAITTHRYSLDAGLTWTNRSPAGADSPVAIGGLTNCARYRVGLRAVNSVGAAAASVTVSNTAGRGGVDAALQSGT